MSASIPVACAQSGILRVDLEQLNVRHRTGHYALAGTVSDARLEEFGRALEYIHREYSWGFAELLDEGRGAAAQRKSAGPSRPAPSEKENDEVEDSLFRVIVFAKQTEYEEFGAAYLGKDAEHTRGQYIRSIQVLLISAGDSPDETYEVLFHEAFHQFLDRHIPHAPMWVNEGLATYYGTARPAAGGLLFDRPQRGYFRIVRDAASAKKLIPLAELMEANRSAFYSRQPIPGTDHDRRALSYAQAYTLCVYMLTDGAGREHLRAYLRELAKAEKGKAVEVTRAHFRPDLLNKVVPQWLAMVNR